MHKPRCARYASCRGEDDGVQVIVERRRTTIRSAVFVAAMTTAVVVAERRSWAQPAIPLPWFTAPIASAHVQRDSLALPAIVAGIAFITPAHSAAQLDRPAAPAPPAATAAVPPAVTLAARERMEQALASTLDAGLPDARFVDWLFTTLAPHLDAPWESRLYWSVRRCTEILPMEWERRRELCVDAGFRLAPEKGVRVVIAAARQLADSEGAPWSATPLEVRRIYIDRFEGTRVVDSLDVPALRDLAARLEMPDREWPAIDLVAAVSASDARPRPGTPVRFTIDAVNRGRRAVQRAIVTLVVQREGADEIRSDWLRDLEGGQTVRIEFTATLPTGNGIAIVTIRAPQTAETFRGGDRRRDPVVAIVGDPTWRRQ